MGRGTETGWAQGAQGCAWAEPGSPQPTGALGHAQPRRAASLWDEQRSLTASDRYKRQAALVRSVTCRHSG